MLKIIPDIHGKNWIIEKQLEELEANPMLQICYLGDHVDSHEFSNVEHIRCYDQLRLQRERFGDRVVCLLGNHEMSYLSRDYRCSGFRATLLPDMEYILNEKIFDWKIAHSYNGNLITHAGVSKKWLDKHFDSILKIVPEFKWLENPNWVQDLAEALNCIYHSRFRYILCEVPQIRGGLRYDYGGPVWCDISEPKNLGCPQVVGHSQIKQITIKGDTTYTDCLNTVQNFLYFN